VRSNLVKHSLSYLRLGCATVHAEPIVGAIPRAHGRRRRELGGEAEGGARRGAAAAAPQGAPRLYVPAALLLARVRCAARGARTFD
jgi:hypothetical protein